MLRFHLIALLGAGVAFAASATAPSLMPLPAVMQPGAGKLTVDGNFSVAASGYTNARLESALDRFAQRLSRQTGILMLTARPSDRSRALLKVECAAAGAEYPLLGEDESYLLDVSPTGAVLKAPNPRGVLHGLETFAQLVGPGAGGFEAPAIHIEDRPRFPWRGLMMDVSRHWMPIEVVKRNLDAMASVKLNVFHWHLSDDQGFRIESKLFPRLQEAGSDGKYFTQEQAREVVTYACDRGIRVVPEFDIPGHTSSWFPGYPELASAPGPYSIERQFGVFDPALDPSREETYTFLDGFIGEMAALFPDAYFHIGGDEVNGKQWKESARIQAFAKEHSLADNDAIQAYFNQRVLKLIEKHGKTMIGWDEILHPNLPKATVIHSWRGHASLADAATKGYSGILSWGYYLDHARPASFHYAVDPLSGPAAKLSPEESARILGGEACMWAELASSETVESRIWPRAAVVAERLWSPKETTDMDSMYARMEAVSQRLDWNGLQHRNGSVAMLDRIAAGRPVDPVRVLASTVEAKGLGTGRSARKNTTLTPLNRLVDAVPVESEVIRMLEQAALRVAANPASAAADISLLRGYFGFWAANDAALQRVAQDNGILMEVQPLSRDLAGLGTTGLRALDYLKGGKPAPPGWAAARLKDLARFDKPVADLSLAAVRPVRVLLGGLSGSKKAK